MPMQKIITPLDLAVLRERMIDKLTLAQIAVKHGVSRQRIHQRLAGKFGVVSSKRQPVALDPEQVAKYLPDWKPDDTSI